MKAQIDNIEAIIWDWNGTLLDDVNLSIKVMNEMLKKRNIKSITKDRYLEIFDFPVKNYYDKLGLDAEKEWDQVAMEFINGYRDHITTVKLFPEAQEILQYFNKKGVKQFILSAMEHDSLLKLVDHFELTQYFSIIQGIEDHFAKGKLKQGRSLIEKIQTDPNKIVFIGDTLHDAEVADSLGVHSVLIARGHHSKQRLIASGKAVYDSHLDLLKS